VIDIFDCIVWEMYDEQGKPRCKRKDMNMPGTSHQTV